MFATIYRSKYGIRRLLEPFLGVNMVNNDLLRVLSFAGQSITFMKEMRHMKMEMEVYEDGDERVIMEEDKSKNDF